ncbi:unnamed protein product [Amoebophrya sp. A25]|nr:unnamed protein product [Amoebophrya sp. A25]|eukprot:GSA25T00021371001.1
MERLEDLIANAMNRATRAARGTAKTSSSATRWSTDDQDEIDFFAPSCIPFCVALSLHQNLEEKVAAATRTNRTTLVDREREGHQLQHDAGPIVALDSEIVPMDLYTFEEERKGGHDEDDQHIDIIIEDNYNKSSRGRDKGHLQRCQNYPTNANAITTTRSTTSTDANNYNNVGLKINNSFATLTKTTYLSLVEEFARRLNASRFDSSSSVTSSCCGTSVAERLEEWAAENRTTARLLLEVDRFGTRKAPGHKNSTSSSSTSGTKSTCTSITKNTKAGVEKESENENVASSSFVNHVFAGVISRRQTASLSKVFLEGANDNQNENNQNNMNEPARPVLGGASEHAEAGPRELSYNVSSMTSLIDSAYRKTHLAFQPPGANLLPYRQVSVPVPRPPEMRAPLPVAASTRTTHDQQQREAEAMHAKWDAYMRELEEYCEHLVDFGRKQGYVPEPSFSLSSYVKCFDVQMDKEKVTSPDVEVKEKEQDPRSTNGIDHVDEVGVVVDQDGAHLQSSIVSLVVDEGTSQESSTLIDASAPLVARWKASTLSTSTTRNNRNYTSPTPAALASRNTSTTTTAAAAASAASKVNHEKTAQLRLLNDSHSIGGGGAGLLYADVLRNESVSKTATTRDAFDLAATENRCLPVTEGQREDAFDLPACSDTIEDYKEVAAGIPSAKKDIFRPLDDDAGAFSSSSSQKTTQILCSSSEVAPTENTIPYITSQSKMKSKQLLPAKAPSKQVVEIVPANIKPPQQVVAMKPAPPPKARGIPIRRKSAAGLNALPGKARLSSTSGRAWPSNTSNLRGEETGSLASGTTSSISSSSSFSKAENFVNNMSSASGSASSSVSFTLCPPPSSTRSWDTTRAAALGNKDKLSPAISARTTSTLLPSLQQEFGLNNKRKVENLPLQHLELEGGLRLPPQQDQEPAHKNVGHPQTAKNLDKIGGGGRDEFADSDSDKTECSEDIA